MRVQVPPCPPKRPTWSFFLFMFLCYNVYYMKFENFFRGGVKNTAMREGSIGLFDKGLSQRAEWMVERTKVQEYLKDRIKFKKPITGKFNVEPNNIEHGVSVLCIGAGKGHEMDEMDQVLPGSEVIGLDPHDYMSRPVADRLENLAHNASYLNKHFQAENLEGIEDGSMDGITLNFVLHHIEPEKHETIFKELRRVLRPDGYVFIAEDLANDEKEAKIVERADRRINMELAEAPHNYRSMEQWFKFFEQNGFEVVDSGEEKPKDVRHGFFVLRQKT
jgi:ubiquinone/menaquinone biosynthesis C-methylase UbiE